MARPKSIALLLAPLLAVPLLFFSLRNPVLRHMVERRASASQGRLVVGSASFRGLSRVVLTDVRLRSADGGLEAGLGACDLELSFWRMVTGRVRFERIVLSDFSIAVVRKGTPVPSSRPEPARPRPGREARETEPPAISPPAPPAPGYGAQAARILRLFFDRIPDSLAIHRFTLRTDIDSVRQEIRIPRLMLQGPRVSTRVAIEARGSRREFLLEGDIDRSGRRLEFRIAPYPRGARLLLPFLDDQWGLRIGFDSVAFRLKSGALRKGTLPLSGSLVLNHLSLNQPRIATTDVRIPGLAVDYALSIGPGHLELSSPTRVRIGRLSFRPTARVQAWPSRQLALRLEPMRFRAQDFFHALPAGLFRNLEGFIGRGELSVALDFAVDPDHPEAVRLEGLLDKGTFRIVRFGRTDFRHVNAPFLHTAWERDQAVRTFPVGPENPDFRPLERVSPYLRDALMISEDGAFFSHRGFLIGPFRESIALNLREKRFARGGSTISMQLVKNLWLKRYKTVARKLEEMIITWLIEENRLISKERMYEIYLNVIEWGPGVFGAGEAARFYFGKEASDLTLAEAIFMASVVPRPKKFMFLFDEEQKLRPWLDSYYRLVSSKMLARGMITPEEHDALRAEVNLSGPARLLLKGQTPVFEETLDLLDESGE